MRGLATSRSHNLAVQRNVMKSWKVILLLGGAAAAAFLLVYYLLGRQDESGKLLLSGFVEQQEVHVGSRQGGRVVQVLVEEGDMVRKDQPLVRLDLEDLLARRAGLEADLAREE